jgi:hypothetical protein
MAGAQHGFKVANDAEVGSVTGARNFSFCQKISQPRPTASRISEAVRALHSDRGLNTNEPAGRNVILQPGRQHGGHISRLWGRQYFRSRFGSHPDATSDKKRH